MACGRFRRGLTVAAVAGARALRMDAKFRKARRVDQRVCPNT